MAIDSSIPLSVQPAQIANPADIFAKAQALRMSQQQQQQESQINKVKLTEAQMQLKQQQQDQQDQQIIRKAYMDSGGDLDDFMSRATKYGAQPSTIIKLKQTILDTKKKSLEMDDATRKNHLEKSDQIRG